MNNPLAVYAQSTSTVTLQQQGAEARFPGLLVVLNYVLALFVIIVMAVLLYFGWKWYKRRKQLLANPTHRVYSKQAPQKNA